MESDVTVVVFSRDLPSLVLYCLKSLERAVAAMGPTEASRLVLIDNGSALPYKANDFESLQVELVRLDQYWSWAAANNLATRRFPNDFYLLVNHNVILPEEVLARMVAFSRAEANVGLVAPRLMNPDGTIHQAGLAMTRQGPAAWGRGMRPDSRRKTNQEVQALSGTCLLAKRAVLDQLGGFDESAGLPDVDLCLRARQRGWRVFCLHEVSALCLTTFGPADLEPSRSAVRKFGRRWAGRYTLDVL